MRGNSRNVSTFYNDIYRFQRREINNRDDDVFIRIKTSTQFLCNCVRLLFLFYVGLHCTSVLHLFLVDSVPTTKLFDKDDDECQAGGEDVAFHDNGPHSELDELSEIERVKRVEFNSIEDSMVIDLLFIYSFTGSEPDAFQTKPRGIQPEGRIVKQYAFF